MNKTITEEIDSVEKDKEGGGETDEVKVEKEDVQVENPEIKKLEKLEELKDFIHEQPE